MTSSTMHGLASQVRIRKLVYCLQCKDCIAKAGRNLKELDVDAYDTIACPFKFCDDGMASNRSLN
jgi:hypothetical protein